MPGFHIHQIPKTKSRPKIQWYWELLNVKGKTIGKSATFYNSRQGCVKNIQAILDMVDAQDLNLYYYHHNNGVVDLYVF